MNMRTAIIFFTVICITSTTVFAQEINIPLYIRHGVQPVMTHSQLHVSKNADIELVGMPSFLDEHYVWKYDFYPAQEIYRQSLSGNISERDQEGLGQIGFEHLSEDEINSQVHVVTGVKEDHLYVIIDANCNRDLNDDQLYKYSLDDLQQDEKYWQQHGDIVSIVYERVVHKKVVRRNVLVRIVPFVFHNNLINPTDKLSKKRALHIITLELYQHRYGEFTIGNKKYSVAVIPTHPFTEHFFDSKIVFHDHTDGLPFRTWSRSRKSYRNDEEVRLGNTMYLIERISSLGDNLTLKMIHGKTAAIEEETENIKSISGTLVNGESATFEFPRERYMLVHFWGSWCAPCIERIPDLKRLAKKRAEKLTLLGIAFDENKTAIENIIQQHDLRWDNIIENNRVVTKLGSKSNMKRFGVRIFPTYILISPTGEILARDRLEHITELLR